MGPRNVRSPDGGRSATIGAPPRKMFDSNAHDRSKPPLSTFRHERGRIRTISGRISASVVSTRRTRRTTTQLARRKRKLERRKRRLEWRTKRVTLAPKTNKRNTTPSGKNDEALFEFPEPQPDSKPKHHMP